MADSDLLKFLEEAGYPKYLDNFKNQDVITVEAARDLTIDELIQDIGTTSLAAKKIYARLHAPSGGVNLPQPSGDAQPNNQQIVPLNHEMQLMRLDHVHDKKIHELQTTIKLNELNTKHAQDMANLSHSNAIASLQKDLDHQKQVAQLQNETTKAVFEGKLAVLEEKTKQKPAIEIPPWWTTAYGPYDPLFYDRYNAFPANSVLLTHHFFRLIQSWMGAPRLWDLRYRATRDGFASANFHGCCDGIGSSVVVVRANGYLFGGYTSTSWSSSQSYQTSPGSFLFTLTNAYGKPHTVFHQKATTNHIYCHSSYGPTFGGGHDLCLSNGCNGNNNSYTAFPSTYNDSLGHGNTTFAGTYQFIVSEIEVFRVW
jgi:hypothetical protein